MDYDIEDRNVFISSDGVHSNLKAYGNSSAECNSHKLDNIVRHFIWSASYPIAKRNTIVDEVGRNQIALQNILNTWMKSERM